LTRRGTTGFSRRSVFHEIKEVLFYDFYAALQFRVTEFIKINTSKGLVELALPGKCYKRSY
jgi:hypothetical protein